MKAPDILKKAAQHMEDRAASRDLVNPLNGQNEERSMARTVASFNALTGHELTERDGWLFMVVLKAARACTTPTGIADDYEDGAAYFALAGEAVAAPAAVNDNAGRRVTIGGLTVDVPERFNFVAQDENGGIWAYTHRPSLNDDDHYWWKALGTEQVQLVKLDHTNAEGWRNSLIELPA